MNHYVITPPSKRALPLPFINQGGILQDVDPNDTVNFTTYTPFNPPPYGGKLVAAGMHFSAHTQTGTAKVIPIALRAYYIPVMIPYPMLIDQISCECTIAEAGKSVKLGIFSIERGKISKNIYTNQTGIGSIGQRLISANVSVGAGSYAFFFMTDASTAEVYREVVVMGLFGQPTSGIKTEISHLYQDLSAFDDDLDDDPTLTVEDTSSELCPRVVARMG